MKVHIVLVCISTIIAIAIATSVRPHKPFTVEGPNGQQLQVTLVGDEHNHRWESTEGYTVKKTENNIWKFVDEDGVSLSNQKPKAPHVVLREFRGGFSAYQSLNARKLPSSTTPKTFKSSSPREIEMTSATPGVFSAASHAIGSLPIFLIAVNFSDFKLLYGSSAWVSRLFTDPDSLQAYYKLNSYNKMIFTPASESCGTSNDGVAEVSLNMNGPNQNDTLEGLATLQIISKLGNCINWAQFDKNNDGSIGDDELKVIFIFAGSEGAYGCIGTYCPSTWAHQSTFGTPLAVGSKKLPSAIYMSELLDCDCTELHQIGTLCHEMGHGLGLPDLYDTYYGTSTTNSHWSLMNGGNWCMDLPCNLDPWSRVQLGWAIPQVLIDTTTVNITQLGTSDSTDVVMLRPNPNGSPWYWYSSSGSGEFFLVENRLVESGQFDEGAPGSGIVLWHIIYNITSQNFINSFDPKMIDVVSAFNYHSQYGSAYDCWSLSTHYYWTCTTTPDIDFYNNDKSCVNMQVLSYQSSEMTAKFNTIDTCSSMCCGDQVLSVGEQCETGSGCSNCQCVDGWTQSTPASFVCDGTSVGNTTSQTCGSYGCPLEWLSNDRCDPVCMNSACNYDLNDCPLAKCTTCPMEWVGDGYCDQNCLTAGCKWDKFDCYTGQLPCNPYCPTSSLGDGVCLQACNTKTCFYDFMDCLPDCPETCFFGNLGNGVCDAACNFQTCDWDGGDCANNNDNNGNNDLPSTASSIVSNSFILTFIWMLLH